MAIPWPIAIIIITACLIYFVSERGWAIFPGFNNCKHCGHQWSRVYDQHDYYKEQRENGGESGVDSVLVDKCDRCGDVDVQKKRKTFAVW